MKKIRLPVYQESPVFQSLGCKNTSIKNIRIHPKKSTLQKKGRLTIECDKMLSFVEMKADKKWIWPAVDLDSREIVGLYAGSRDQIGAERLWKSLPPVYRQCAVCYSDFWSAYEKGAASKKASSRGKRQRKNQSYRTVQPYLATKSFVFGEKNAVFSQKAGKSHWHHMEFYPPLQFRDCP